MHIGAFKICQIFVCPSLASMAPGLTGSTSFLTNLKLRKLMQKAQRPCHTWLNPIYIVQKNWMLSASQWQASLYWYWSEMPSQGLPWRLGGRDEYSAYVLHMYYICGMLNRLGLFGLGLDQIVKGRARLDVKVSGPGCGVPNLMISTMPSRLDRTLQYIERTWKNMKET